MKKKLLALCMMVVLAFSMTACGGAALESEGDISFSAPEGFVYDEAEETWFSPDYPNVLANINYYSTSNDGSFKQLTKAAMEPALEDSLSSTYGTTIDLDITVWKEITVDGYEAVDYTIEYDYMGMDIMQRQVVVNGKDNFHYVTMTALVEEGYNDEFDAVVASIKFSRQ